MVSISTGALPQDVLQGAAHVLFVEGTKEGLDVTVLHELLTPKLRVEPLGPSYSVRSVATALHQFHPKYWFIIDRDEWNDDDVEASWNSFPDPNTDNLLIWRRKELESYFLEPTWVSNSRYLKRDATASTLEEWLASEASKKIWLEVANRVLINKRNLVKRQPAALFSPSDLAGLSRDQVIDKLVSSSLLTFRNAVSIELSEVRVRASFEDEAVRLSGGGDILIWGQGRWRELISAKSLFRAMVNRWFLVPDESTGKGKNAQLTGRDAERAVAVDLLKHHTASMPSDFGELKSILERAVT